MSEINASVLELMASKLCHDVISPVGAISNGVEFLEDMGMDAGDEAVQLIAFSANQASAKLQAFRYAYGAGGADPSIKPEDIHTTFEAVIAPDGKVSQNWDPHVHIGPEERPEGLCKTIMNVLLLSFDTLPKGGQIRLEPVNKTQVLIHADGENANFSELADAALRLDLDISDLSPKLVHPYLTSVLAQNYQLSVSLHQLSHNSVTFAIHIPEQ